MRSEIPPFFVNGNNGISIRIDNWINDDQSFFTSQTFLEQVSAFSRIRWNVIAASISIEALMSASIEYILFDERNDITEFFQDRFLKSSIVTFHQKWRILRDLCKLSPKTQQFYNHNIVSSIHKCIEDRNKFAHGVLVFDANKTDLFLEYFSDNEVRNLGLWKELEAIQAQFYPCLNSITQLVYWPDNSVQRYPATLNKV